MIYETDHRWIGQNWGWVEMERSGDKRWVVRAKQNESRFVEQPLHGRAEAGREICWPAGRTWT